MKKIHDNQHHFRILLESFAYPGRRYRLCPELPENQGLLKTSLAIASVVLDHEVSYYVDALNHLAHETLQIQTQSNAADAANADYLFIPRDSTSDHLVACLDSAKRGTLLNPEQSATLIIETAGFDQGVTYVLSGPGIKTEQTMTLGLDPRWMLARQQAIEEFPLGIDLIFVSVDHEIISLPRTVEIREE